MWWIKQEYTATRCDVCHQSDMFDPVTNGCYRCKELAISEVGNSLSLPSVGQQVARYLDVYNRRANDRSAANITAQKAEKRQRGCPLMSRAKLFFLGWLFIITSILFMNATMTDHSFGLELYITIGCLLGALVCFYKSCVSVKYRPLS